MEGKSTTHKKSLLILCKQITYKKNLVKTKGTEYRNLPYI